MSLSLPFINIKNIKLQPDVEKHWLKKALADCSVYTSHYLEGNLLKALPVLVKCHCALAWKEI